MRGGGKGHCPHTNPSLLPCPPAPPLPSLPHIHTPHPTPPHPTARACVPNAPHPHPPGKLGPEAQAAPRPRLEVGPLHLGGQLAAKALDLVGRVGGARVGVVAVVVVCGFLLVFFLGGGAWAAAPAAGCSVGERLGRERRATAPRAADMHATCPRPPPYPAADTRAACPPLLTPQTRALLAPLSLARSHQYSARHKGIAQAVDVPDASALEEVMVCARGGWEWGAGGAGQKEREAQREQGLFVVHATEMASPPKKQTHMHTAHTQPSPLSCLQLVPPDGHRWPEVAHQPTAAAAWDLPAPRGGYLFTPPSPNQTIEACTQSITQTGHSCVLPSIPLQKTCQIRKNPRMWSTRSAWKYLRRS